jgi:hypothetical protein
VWAFSQVAVCFSCLDSFEREQFNMSRKEIVVLVSRALAIIQLISALLEVTYLPGRFMTLIHHGSRSDGGGDYYRTNYQVDIITFVFRIAGLLIIAIILWNCGPWVERMLTPRLQEGERLADLDVSSIG